MFSFMFYYSMIFCPDLITTLSWCLRYFPFGIIFLVAGKILDMQDPSTLGKKLGWYGITVLAGLFVHGLILLPLFYFILTKKNPFSYIRGLLQAMVIALATSSRSESTTVLGPADLRVGSGSDP